MPPFQLEAPFKPCGDQGQAIDKLVAGIVRRPEAPSSARCDRVRQDLYDGQCGGAGAEAYVGAGP